MMVTYIELPYLFTVTHSFFLHGFNNHLFEFTCVFLVRYPFRHIKSPHLLTVYHMSDKWGADHIRGALSVVLTGQPFVSCPVLFFDCCSNPWLSELKQQFHAVFRLRTTVLADTVMLRQCSCEAQEAHQVSQRIRLR